MGVVLPLMGVVLPLLSELHLANVTLSVCILLELVKLDEMLGETLQPLLELLVLGREIAVIHEAGDGVVALHPGKPPVTDHVVLPLIHILKLQELALGAPEFSNNSAHVDVISSALYIFELPHLLIGLEVQNFVRFRDGAAQKCKGRWR